MRPIRGDIPCCHDPWPLGGDPAYSGGRRDGTAFRHHCFRTWEADVTTNPAEAASVPADLQQELEEIIRAKQPRPIESVEDFTDPGVFDSDEEVDAFIAFTYAE